MHALASLTEVVQFQGLMSHLCTTRLAVAAGEDKVLGIDIHREITLPLLHQAGPRRESRAPEIATKAVVATETREDLHRLPSSLINHLLVFPAAQ